MEDNILDFIKDAMGVDDSESVFDNELLMHINSVFVTLRQLGVRPDTTFVVDDTSLWTDFMSDLSVLPLVKSYVVLRVRSLFDPPNSSSFNEAMKNTISEYEWRLQMDCDTYKVEEDPKYADRIT